MDPELFAALAIQASTDPVTIFLNGDWGRIGGWGLFVSLCLFFVIGAFRETWVPGARYRRLEVAAQALAKANDNLIQQNGLLLKATELQNHFFDENTPKRGGRINELVRPESDSPESR